MPVDKFGGMDEQKTTSGGVSLSYISNNFLRKDGTTAVTGSLNMNGNILTRISNPVNPQDVATKNYVDSAKGMIVENGGFNVQGYLNINFNTIKNVKEPENSNEVATKNYVDSSGRAIVQQHDGSFSAVSNINMRGYTLTGVIDPAEPQDVATKNYVDGANRAFVRGPGGYLASGDVSMGGRRITNLGTPIENSQAVNKYYVDAFVNAATTNLATKSYVDNKVSLPSLIGPKPIISIHAEEQGALANGEYEFSFGNGSSGRDHGVGGYCMSAPGRILRGSLMVVGKRGKILQEEVKVNIVINGVEQIANSLIKNVDEKCSCAVFEPPLEVNQCDVINFITRTNNPDARNSYVTLLVELDL